MEDGASALILFWVQGIVDALYLLQNLAMYLQVTWCFGVFSQGQGSISRRDDFFLFHFGGFDAFEGFGHALDGYILF